MIRRILSIAALPLLLSPTVLGLTGCSGTVPTAQEMAAEDKESQVAQLIRIADSTREAGDLASAAGLYRRAHELAPEKREALVRLGDTLLVLGAFPEAAQAYAKAVELDAADTEALYGQGKALTALGQYQDAVERFRAAIKANGKDHRFFSGFGVALDYLGDHESAQQAYIDGLEVAPDAIGLRNNLAFSMLLGGEFAGAIAHFEEIARNPLATPRHRQNLALAYGLAGKKEKAAAIARRDLDEAEVAHNMAVYERLRRLSGEERALELLGVRDAQTPDS